MEVMLEMVVIMVTIEVGVDGYSLVFILVCFLRQDHSVADWELTVSPTILPYLPRGRDHGSKPPRLTLMCFSMGAFFPSPNCLLKSREDRLLCLAPAFSRTA